MADNNKALARATKRLGHLLFVCFLALSGSTAVAQETVDKNAPGEALWELGLGLGVAAYPNYRGSREYNVIPAPLPVVIYRGDILKVSRDGARAELIDHPRLDISISGNGTLPVDSNDDELRRGLPDLDPTLGIGPKISWLFTDPEQRDTRSLRFILPVYGVAALDFDNFETIGFISQPQLRWRQGWQDAERDRAWSYNLSAGPLFATGEYHDYFYSVSSRFATAQRSAFNANGGYSGFAGTAGIYHRRGRLRMGAVLSVDYLKGAAFEDSPLVATTEAYTAGLFVAWTFWESETRASEPAVE